MSAAAVPEPEPEEEEREMTETSSAKLDMSALQQRISSVQETDTLRQTIEQLPAAFVLVFDEDTDEEAVYSMEMEGSDNDGKHVVLAFEERSDAVRYALSLAEDGTEEVASVQALDVEALVVTSRDADFAVGMVLKGDLVDATTDGVLSFINRPDATKVAVSITLVPDAVFEGRTSDDLLDPAEDPVWVLVHDEGTGDAQFFSMNLNGTDSVVCFKDENAALRCGRALKGKGVSRPAPRSLYLDELLDTLENEAVVDVCLVDEVVETIVDDDDPDSWPGVVASDGSDEVLGYFGDRPPPDRADDSRDAQSSAEVRLMLDRLYGEANEGAEDSADDDDVDGCQTS